MMNATKPYSPTGDYRASNPMWKPRQVRVFASPSPRPSPLGRGRTVGWLVANRARLKTLKCGRGYSLSPREMTKVRGKRVRDDHAYRDFASAGWKHILADRAGHPSCVIFCALTKPVQRRPGWGGGE